MPGRLCYYIPVDSYIEERGYRVSVVTEGEPGHTPTGDWPYDGTGVMPYFWGHDLEQAKEIARKENQKLGLSEVDALQIVSSSMAAQNRGRRRKR